MKQVVQSIFFVGIWCLFVSTTQTGDSTYLRTTYYAKKFHNRKTANGEIYRMEKYTAASNQYAFGTFLLVKNESNGKEVVVKVNDRMSKRARAKLDLSTQAAKELGIIKIGVKKLLVKVISSEEAAQRGHADAVSTILKEKEEK